MREGNLKLDCCGNGNIPNEWTNFQWNKKYNSKHDFGCGVLGISHFCHLCFPLFIKRSKFPGHYYTNIYLILYTQYRNTTNEVILRFMLISSYCQEMLSLNNVEYWTLNWKSKVNIIVNIYRPTSFTKSSKEKTLEIVQR